MKWRNRLEKFNTGDVVEVNGGYSFDPSIARIREIHGDMIKVELISSKGIPCKQIWDYKDRDIIRKIR